MKSLKPNAKSIITFRMKNREIKFRNVTAVILIILLLFSCSENPGMQEPAWPEITRENKPWTRWWLMGNILTPATVAEAMEEYQKAGLGGLEITPIYGVKGYEKQFIDYLSPEWMDMLQHILKEGNRLDLGIDMAGSSGWPFGGPWVTEEDACKNFAYKTYDLSAGSSLAEKIEYQQEPMVHGIRNQFDIRDIVEPVGANNDLQKLALTQVRYPKSLPLQALMAFSDSGDVFELTDKVNSAGELDWVAPAGNWTLIALFQGWHGKLVERAGPGGEGDVIDHFSAGAVDRYLSKFDEVFKGKDLSGLRAFFNDSYEVDDAAGESNWTPAFFHEFEVRRGYDLKEKLPALLQNEDEEHLRVLTDFRETFSDLILENFTQRWQSWAGENGFIIRNQAHGSPANILDLYAASDIPETEGRNIQKIKFASSAAHITGKKYASSESATLLNEHFISSLGDVKPVLDLLMLGGVNHIFYHGTTFSPKSEPWPGWLFYAAVHFDPVNSFWTDFAQLNRYVARCQSFLQDGQPDNDILLYFPIYDKWFVEAGRRGMLEHIGGGAGGTSAGINADTMLATGYSFDFISDRQIRNLQVQDHLFATAGITFKTIVLPKCRFLPVETFEKLVQLANDGATVIIDQELPQDVPGLGNLEERREKYRRLKEDLHFKAVNGSNISVAKTGSGRFILGPDLKDLLEFAKIRREPMADAGLSFIRRKIGNETVYFVVNRTDQEFAGWIPLKSEGSSVAVFNPMTDEVGAAKMRESGGNVEVYVQMAPRESWLLKTYDSPLRGNLYRYPRPAGDAVMLTGKWKVDFLSGGPRLPQSVEVEALDSWTNFASEGVKDFSGTAAYAISFSTPSAAGDGWMLDLGRVCESAKVILNGRELGTLIKAPYRVLIPSSSLQESNTLEVRVSNLMANRIAYIDRQGQDWKKFYNANIPGRLEENRGPDRYFTAKHWLPRESGIIGPVTLTPVAWTDANEEAEGADSGKTALAE